MVFEAKNLAAGGNGFVCTVKSNPNQINSIRARLALCLTLLRHFDFARAASSQPESPASVFACSSIRGHALLRPGSQPANPRPQVPQVNVAHYPRLMISGCRRHPRHRHRAQSRLFPSPPTTTTTTNKPTTARNASLFPRRLITLVFVVSLVNLIIVPNLDWL